MNRVGLLHAIGALSVISACTSSSLKPAGHEETRQFAIAAEDAPTALNEFSRQSDKQVLFDFMALRNRQTHSVEGALKPSEALQQMLKGTGLYADNVNEHTIAIMPH